MLIEASIRYGTAMPELLPQGMFRQGVDVVGPAGTTVRYDGMIESRGADIPPALEFLMDVGSGATATLIAAWIIDRFRGRSEKITINRRQVDLDDEGQVRRVVEEAPSLGSSAGERSSIWARCVIARNMTCSGRSTILPSCAATHGVRALARHGRSRSVDRPSPHQGDAPL